MKKQIIKLLSILFPNKVVELAYKQLTNPQVKKLREHELDVLNKLEKEVFKFQNFDIQLYHWQGGEDKVFLAHGWEGQAGNFSDIIERLIAENFSIYTFDAPSHGFSSRGDTSLFEFTELVAVLIKKFDIKKIVSHSFGSVATTWALYTNPNILIEKYIILAGPDTFMERIEDVSNNIGVTEKVKTKLIKNIEQELKIDVRKLGVSEFVKNINVEKGLMIHDKHDKVIPIYRAQNVHQNWKNAELIEVEGTGHFRILRTPFVINMIVSFLSE